MLPDQLDRLAHQDGPIHRQRARVKVAIAAMLLAAIAVTPLSWYPIHVGAALFLIAAVILARMPFGYLVRRLLVFWPMVVLLAVGIPVSHGLADGWLRMATVIVKATLAYLTVLALMATTPFDHVLWALRWFRVPRLLVAVIALMVRYLAVLTDELQRMQRARASRMFHRPGPADWLELPKLIGRLFIRSLERGERIHQAMLARGWTGEIHLL